MKKPLSPNSSSNVSHPADGRTDFHQFRNTANCRHRFQHLSLLFMLFLAIASSHAELILTYDSRKLELARGNLALGPGGGTRWDSSMDQPYISSGSDQEIAHQVASQSSFFSQYRIEGIGGAMTTYKPGHANCGAEANSNLEFRFTVTKAVSFRFKASCHGGKVNDNLLFTGPLPLGQIAHIHIDEQAVASGTLIPGNYILRAKCHTHASDSWREGGWEFELDLGTPPVLKVDPSPLDFGSVDVRQEKVVTLGIYNEGPVDSVLAGRIFQPSNLAFTVIGAPMDFEARRGQPCLVQVRVRAPNDPALYNSPIVGGIPIHSTDPAKPIVYAPVLALLKSPVKVATRGISNGNLVIEFPSELGRAYSIERCTNLTSISWASLSNVVGSGAPVVISIPVNAAPAAFFRVLSQ